MANLYGQVSCDYAVSQLLTVEHIELGKSHYINRWGLQTTNPVLGYQDM